MTSLLSTVLYLLVVIVVVAVTIVAVMALRQNTDHQAIGYFQLQTQHLILRVIVWIVLEAFIFSALALISGGVIALCVRLLGVPIHSSLLAVLATIIPLAGFVVWVSTFRRIWRLLQRENTRS